MAAAAEIGGSSSLAAVLQGCLGVRSGQSWEWLTALAVVDFDHDVGHVLGECYPSPRLLSEAEAAALCFAAMPDSQPSGAGGGLGDDCFAFRLIRGSAPPLWGFALYRAQRETTCKRGVNQKSVVLLTPLPLFRLFRAAVAVIADAYFARGSAALRDAFLQLSTWGTPRAAETLAALTAIELPLFERTLILELVPARRGPAHAVACAVGGTTAYVAEQSWLEPLCGLGSEQTPHPTPPPLHRTICIEPYPMVSCPAAGDRFLLARASESLRELARACES